MNLGGLPCRDQAVHVPFSCAFTKYAPQSLAAHEMRACKQSSSKTSSRALGQGGGGSVYQQCTKEASSEALNSQPPNRSLWLDQLKTPLVQSTYGPMKQVTLLCCCTLMAAWWQRLDTKPHGGQLTRNCIKDLLY